MIFGSTWSKYDENSETYRVALERNPDQRIELQVSSTECIFFRNHPAYQGHLCRWLSSTKSDQIFTLCSLA